MENWLLSFADGHGGIQTIEKTGTSALVDTYTITFSDATTSTFTVMNGRSISNLTSSKSGKVTTVTITYNDGTTSTLTVRDGEDVSSITEYWAVSTSGSTTPQSWQTTPQTLTATYKYLWHYTRYTYTDGTSSSTTPAVQGVYGDKGDTGDTGTSITGIAKTGTSGLVDTYTVTMSNGTTTTFTVTNGSEIESIVKTSTAGLVDTYTVTMGNGETHTFTVTNGRSIVSFTQTSGTHAAGTIDVYTITYNDGDTSQIQVYNGANGTGAVSSVAGIGVSGSTGDVPLIIQDYGAPTTATVGQVNQLYFDKTGGIMYICISTAGGTYDWRGMSSAVDSALSTTSANPVQNRIISAKVGVGSLDSTFSATNLTEAANELQAGKVPNTRTINGLNLSANRTLTAENIGYDDTLATHTADSVGEELSELKGSLTSLEPLRPQQKHLIIMGDSYSINDEWTGWIEQFKGITNFDVVAESGVGGSGFIGAPDIPTVLRQLANLTVENPDIITDIVIMGGYNDASARYYYGATEANFKTVIDSFASYARGRFKNAKIHYGFIAVDEHNNGFQQELNITRLMLERRCGEAGIAFIPNAHCILLNHNYILQSTTNTNAGSHPNTTGTLEVARFLDNYLSSGYSDVVYGGVIRGLNLYVKNGYVYTFPTEKVFDGLIPDGSVFSAGQWYDLAYLFIPATDTALSYICGIWWGTHDPLTAIQFYLPCYDSDGFKDNVLFRIMDKKLQMYSGSGMTFNGAGYCKAFPFSAPLEPSFG